MDEYGLSNSELEKLLQQLKENLSNFPNGMQSLEYELEASAKHMPTYMKIVKNHIDQLEKVLSLESHNKRTLETAGLAPSVQQLIKLFKQINPYDIELIEDLANTTKNWQFNNNGNNDQVRAVTLEATETSTETSEA